MCDCIYMYMQLLRAILEFGGRSKRTSELFETATPLSMTRKFFKGLKVSCLSISQHLIISHAVYGFSSLLHYDDLYLLASLVAVGKGRRAKRLIDYVG